MATAAAAAGAARARRQIIAYFHATHAIGAEDAVAYQPQRFVEQRVFDRMLRSGVVRQAGEGRYWLDLDALRAEEERRRRIMVPVLIAVSVAMAVILVLFYR
ncbi:hypothetical protein [Sphingomonas sp.]|uniref:hypothetical protein n=1 Tax=Sphingomonas sp. TaxID=28214 RepID=UPI001B0CAB0E|nr:hypothetical protein [Sphingomonas sp.]MBO9711378.1 hypothetical protein [Sphingomonas sp.]